MKCRACYFFLFLSAVARAHDFWIEPATFRPKVGQELPIGLRVGEQFKGDTVHRKKEKIKVFAVLPPGSRDPAAISSADGADQAGVIKIEEAGVHLIGFHNHPTRIEIEPSKFEEYLNEEGLETIIAERAKRGESQKNGREIYSRCAKTIVAVGDGPLDGHDRRFDFPLELTPLQNPASLKPRDELTVRLTLREKPLAGAKVSARRRGASDQAASYRTDADGQVQVFLDQPDIWLITSVHMARTESNPDADWESLWASLTFELPQANK